MRVLWVSHAAGLGGAELALAEGVAALAERGIETHVLLPREGPLRERLSTAAAIHVVPYNGWANAPSIWAAMRWVAHDVLRARGTVASLARQLDVDLCVTNTVILPVGALAARSARIPHAWFIHEFGSDEHGVRFLLGVEATLRIVDRLSAVVIVNSEALHSYLASWVHAEKLSLVRYAVNVPALSVSKPLTQKPFRLILVGAKAPGKGQAEAIKAVGVLADRGLDIDLELVGDGAPAYEDELRRLSEECGVTRRVRFIPFDANPFERMARSHVVLMCSRREAFGRVTVEAMKLGKPVVGAASGGTLELVRPGWNGLLYRPGDPEDLAARIEELIRDPEAVRLMGERGRTWACKTFTASAYGAALKAVFEKALSRRLEAAGPPRTRMP